VDYLSDDDFPIKDRIDKVYELQDDILRHTTILSEHLQKIDVENNNNEENVRIIKREIRTIINGLSKLSGFCNDKSKKQIVVYSEIGSQFNILTTANSFYDRRRIIDYWATRVNAIALDYNNYPFEITGGLEINHDIFKGYIKTGYKRSGFPGGIWGGIVVILILLILIYVYLSQNGII